MADKKLGIDIEFRGRSVELDNNLEYINKNIKTLKKDIKALDKDLKLDLNVENLNKSLETVKYALAESEKASELLQKSISEIKFPAEAQKAFDLNGYNKSLEEAQSKFNGLHTALDAQNVVTKELKKKYDELNKTLQNIDTLKSIENLKSLREELRKVGDSLTGFSNAFKGLSTLSMAGLGGAFTAAKDFESAFVGVMKTVDETATTTYDDIEKSIRKMAQTLPSSTTEIAGVMEIAGQLGVQADNLEKFTKVIIDLGNATNIVGQEGATQIAQFYNIMKGDLDTVDRFGAALTHLGNNSATTEADILRMATNLAGVGANLKMTEQDVLGLATGLASVGISAEKGGSAISNILLKISREVETNGDQLEAWADVAGMTATNFKKAWNENTVSTFFKVIKGLGTLEDENASLIEVLDDVNVKNIRQIDTLSRLANSYSNLDSYLEMSNDAWNQNAALTTEASRRYQTVDSQIEILKNTITEMALQLGKDLLPVVKDLIGFVKPLVKSFGEWVGANSSLVSSMLIFTPAFTSLTGAFGKFLTNSANLVTSMIRLKETTVGMTGVTGGLAKAIGYVGTGGLVAAIVAATGAATYLFIKMQQNKDEIYQTKKAFEEASTTFSSAFDSAETSYANSNQTLQNLLKSNKSYINDLDTIYEKLQNENLTTAERKQLEEELLTQINLVNGALGSNAYAYDEETGQLSIFSQAIDGVKSSYEQLMQALQVQSWLQSHEDAYNKAIESEQKWDDVSNAAWERYKTALQGITNDEIPQTEEEVQKLREHFASLGEDGEYSLHLLDKAWLEYTTTMDTVNAGSEEQLRLISLYEQAQRGEIDNIQELLSLMPQRTDLEKQNTNELEASKMAWERRLEAIDESDTASKEYAENQIRLIEEEEERRKLADENEALSYQERMDRWAAANDYYKSQSWQPLVSEIEADLQNIDSFTFQPKVIDIYEEYHGASGGMPSYSATGSYRSSNYGVKSGGFGDIVLNNNIHVNNNGQPINTQEINRWVKEIAKGVNRELGRNI